MFRPSARTRPAPRAHRWGRRAFRSTATAVLAALALLAAGCTAGSTTTSADTDSVSLGLIAEPASLDFTRDDGAAIPQALLVNVYEGLVKLDSQGKIVPLLAKRWKISDDRRTYTFTLREGVKFSDGAPFTAEDAVFSINRVKTEWTSSMKERMSVVEGANALSPTKLEVRLSRPSNNWLYAMTTRVGAMFSRTGVSDLATEPIGTGPFVVRKWTRGDRIELAARDDYWGKQTGAKKIVLRYFKEATALNNAVLSGGLDVMATVQAPESLSQFSDKKKYRINDGLSTGEVVLSFNNARKPFTDRRVRQAIRYGIDHKALLDTAWAGHGKLIGSMATPTDPWYEDLTGRYPYNPKKARSLLAQAGVKNPTLQLRIPNLPYAVASGQVVKSQLKRIGITATIDVLEFPARWLDEVYTKADYDMSIIAHVEPRDVLSWGDPDYYWKYDNPKLRRLFEAADIGTEKQEVENMKKAVRLLSDDAAADWLFAMPNLSVSSTDVEGLPKNAVSEALDLTAVRKTG